MMMILNKKPLFALFAFVGLAAYGVYLMNARSSGQATQTPMATAKAFNPRNATPQQRQATIPPRDMQQLLEKSGLLQTKGVQVLPYDLNRDGTPEYILTQTQYSPEDCARDGCPMLVFTQGAKGEGLRTLMNVLSFDAIMTPEVKNGYQSILLNGEALWRFNGTAYAFATKIPRQATQTPE